MAKFNSLLTPEQRETIQLYFLEGYALKEIAELTGRSLANVRSHYWLWCSLTEIIQPGAREGESKARMAAHSQRWVKVNAPIDEGVSEIVEMLNRVEGLETLQSCQGDPGIQDGYVYFCFGKWQELCAFVFQKIGPVLKRRVDEDAILTIEATDADAPMAKLSFRAEAAGMVASALKEGLGYERP